MKKILSGLLLVAVLFLPVFAKRTPKKNIKADDYKLLFDGKTTKGWHTYLKTSVGAAWKVADGALVHSPGSEGEGDLVTDDEYENFELSVDWNIAKGGNSGIIFSIHEDPEMRNTYDSGLEMQVLDNVNAEDNKKASHLAGSLYDMIAPSKDVAKPFGEWNTAVIRKQNGHLTFWLNGTKIVETQMGSDEWATLLANSKFKSWKNFAMYPKGHISLQAHGGEVSYRNIKIKQL